MISYFVQLAILALNKYLFEIYVESNDGPRRASRQVALLKGDGLFPSAAIREHSEIVTEFIPSKNTREANFIHQDWSTSAASTTSPWIKLRIAKTNEVPPRAHSWVTKRTLVHRLRISPSVEDLVPTLAFADDIRKALANPIRPAIFQALNRKFQYWSNLD